MKFNWKGTIMKNILNHSQNLAARSCAGCLPGLLLLAVLLVIVTPVRAEKPPTYLFEIDSNAVPGGFQPIAVALDSSNNLYVADEYNDRVEKFTGNGNYAKRALMKLPSLEDYEQQAAAKTELAT
jgi:hypothetical protein